MYVTQYTYLLTSQLESQRLYFEEKMENVERQSQRQVWIAVAYFSRPAEVNS